MAHKKSNKNDILKKYELFYDKNDVILFRGNQRNKKVTDEIEIVLPEGDNQDMPSAEEGSPVIEGTRLITPDVIDEQPLENEGNEKSETIPVAKTTVKKSTKSKEEETIDMGNGSIVDLQ